MSELSATRPIYQDEHLLVLVKPAGLLCVPGRGPDKQDCFSARIQAIYPEALIVHRLDMATSGLWLMARSPEMQRRLGRAFERRQVAKRYVAVVAGALACPAPNAWNLIDLPIAADWERRPLQVIDRERGKPSQTRWRCVPAPLRGEPWLGSCTRIELEPLTGRSHQLRLHLQALGHPILGDTLYAPPEVQARAPRLLLHASELGFEHPASGQPLAFSCPAPF